MKVDEDDKGVHIFQLRIVTLDFVLRKPSKFCCKSSKYSGKPLRKVPVVRLFGTTPGGQKACLYVHRIFPYLLLPLKRQIRLSQHDELFGYIVDLIVELKSHVATFCNENFIHGEVIYDVETIEARDFYGFHEDPKTFIKLYLVYPSLIAPLAQYLQSGTVLNEVIEPYEAHIPFLLHFCIDHNLYGMDFIKLKDFTFRRPLPKRDTDDTRENCWFHKEVPSSLLTSKIFKKQTRCAIEVDCIAENILNRKELVTTPIAEADYESCKLVPSLVPIWEKERRRRRKEGFCSNVPVTPSLERKQIIPDSIERKYRNALSSQLRKKEGKLSDDFNLENLSQGFLSDAIPSRKHSETPIHRPIHDSLGSRLHKIKKTLSQERKPPVPKRPKFRKKKKKSRKRLILTPEPIKPPLQASQSPKEFVESSPLGFERLSRRSQVEDFPSDMEEIDEIESFGDDEELEEQVSQDLSAIRETALTMLSQQEKNDGAAVTPVQKVSFMQDDLPFEGDVDGPFSQKSDDDDDVLSKRSQSPLVADIFKSRSPGISKTASPLKKLRFSKKRGKDSDSFKLPSPKKKFDSQSRSELFQSPTRVDDDFDGLFSQKSDDDDVLSKRSQSPLVADIFKSQSPGISPLKMLRFSPKRGKHSDSFKSPSPKRRFDSPSRSEFFQSPTKIDASPTASPKFSPPDPLQEKSPPIFHNSDVSIYPNSIREIDKRSDGKTEDIATRSRSKKSLGKRRASSMRFVVPAPKRKPGQKAKWSLVKIIERSEDGTRMKVHVKDKRTRRQKIKWVSTKAPRTKDIEDLATEQTIVKKQNDVQNESPRPKQKPAPKIMCWTFRKRPPNTEELLREINQTQSSLSIKNEQGHIDSAGRMVIMHDESKHTFPPTLRHQMNQLAKKYSEEESVDILSMDEHAQQHLTIMSLEIIANCRGNMLPDPKKDEILVLCIAFDIANANQENYVLFNSCNLRFKPGGLPPLIKLSIFENERALLRGLLKLVWKFDPDILVGYEIQKQSWGYVTERSLHLQEIPLNILMGRDIIENEELYKNKQKKEAQQRKSTWFQKKASGVKVPGRIVLNIWRLLRADMKLRSYTFENVVYNILGWRVPRYPLQLICQWLKSNRDLYRAIYHTFQRSLYDLQMLDSIDLITRTSEMARVYGIDFYSVLSRGSQYRVESMLARLCKTQGFILLSCSRDQLANQCACESIPLVLEPVSKVYTDPVAVLDFQSLYPTMMIAYNICYSTCLGKISDPLPQKLGVRKYQVPDRILKKYGHDGIWISPAGVMFLKAEQRPGILSRMMREILDTRIMTKRAMKEAKNDRMKRLYNARQFSLKMIANVTYGYTAASFSGRMPCAEIADSIVQTARQTLENTIDIVNKTSRWGAEVKYGDTDSVFVLFKGKSIEEAFRIGSDIARRVTDQNPKPVKLELEKIYEASALVSKKRYVGLKYDHVDQIKPTFDAKGIEIVRRDTCPLVSKSMEAILRLIFRCAAENDKDQTATHDYMVDLWQKIMQSQVSWQDLIFRKEVKLGTYKVLPPAAIVAMKAMNMDPRAEPLFAQRQPFVVIAGTKKDRLIDLVMDPHIAISNVRSRYKINSHYYIKTLNSVIGRILALVQIDVEQWYAKCPRLNYHIDDGHEKSTKTLSYWIRSKNCSMCSAATKKGKFCQECLRDSHKLVRIMSSRIQGAENDLSKSCDTCHQCMNHWKGGPIPCVSLDCSSFFTHRKTIDLVRRLRNQMDSIHL